MTPPDDELKALAKETVEAYPGLAQVSEAAIHRTLCEISGKRHLELVHSKERP